MNSKICTLKESLEIILPITRGAISQLKSLAPKGDAWTTDECAGYREEEYSLIAVEQYLKYLKKNNNDTKIRVSLPQKKEWFGGKKTIPFPEEL